jgi:hypothetical protein
LVANLLPAAGHVHPVGASLAWFRAYLGVTHLAVYHQMS